METKEEISNEQKALIREKYLNASRVIVAGGRDFDDYALLSQKLDNLLETSDELGGHEIEIISGMAKGADTLAIRYADERRLTKILFPANWKKHPRMAGILRNEDMLSIATHLVAFWDGKSNGTGHIIEKAKEMGIPVWVYNYKMGC